MSTASVMLVKDEADIIESIVENLLVQTDVLYVADNLSTDGTFEILSGLEAERPDRVRLTRDEEVGYWQSRKTTALAMEALRDGHQWVVPSDADEWWYGENDRLVKDVLAGVSPDVYIVEAKMFNFFPSVEDAPQEAVRSPVERISWRQREHQVLPKVACRLMPDLTIEPGNHSASFQFHPRAQRSRGLAIRHYSWRTTGQYVRKIRNGQRAYEATTLDPGYGGHWRMWDGATDKQIAEHFETHFVMLDPRFRDDLTWDPLT